MLVGQGTYGWMATGTDGSIHVAYEGKYRKGKLGEGFQLGPERQISPDYSVNFMNVKLDLDGVGHPHVVYQKGKMGSATACYYISGRNGTWSAPERFAAKEDIGSSRTAMPDVAADAAGNVLASFWAVENAGGLGTAVYRWRGADGKWRPYQGKLSSYHAATPKVQSHKNRFYLHYAANDFDKILTGPVDALSDFKKTGVSFNSQTINRSFQNEGTDFTISAGGKIAAAGNFRKTSGGGGVGIWASDNFSGSFKAVIVAELDGPHSGGKGEGHQQPSLAIDESTGDIYLAYFYEKDQKAYYHVKKGGTWSGPKKLFPEDYSTQGYFRNPPSLADIPGPGVAACFTGMAQIYLRTIGAPAGTSALWSKPSSRHPGLEILQGSRLRLRNNSLEPQSVGVYSLNGHVMAQIVIGPHDIKPLPASLRPSGFLLRTLPAASGRRSPLLNQEPAQFHSR